MPSALEVPAKRTRGALTLLNVGGCDGCGKLIMEAEKGNTSKVTECSKKGCKKHWVCSINSYKFNLHLKNELQFHRECTDGLQEKLPKNWACDLCKTVLSLTVTTSCAVENSAKPGRPIPTAWSARVFALVSACCV
jgi:hypothetical protein